jgi:hypothetical protein
MNDRDVADNRKTRAAQLRAKNARERSATAQRVSDAIAAAVAAESSWDPADVRSCANCYTDCSWHPDLQCWKCNGCSCIWYPADDPYYAEPVT